LFSFKFIIFSIRNLFDLHASTDRAVEYVTQNLLDQVIRRYILFRDRACLCYVTLHYESDPCYFVTKRFIFSWRNTKDGLKL